MRHYRLALALFVYLSSPAEVFAQAKGFALDRFEPAEPGSEWFSTESLDFRGHLRPAAGVTLDYAHKPLVIYDAQGDEVASLVQNQLFLHLGGGVSLWQRVRLGAELPFALVVSGERGVVGGVSYAASGGPHLGDLRLNGQGLILGEPGEEVVLAGGLQIHVPTGSRAAFTGDGSARFTPRLLVAGDMGSFAYSARLGLQLRTQRENFGGVPLGSEIAFGAASGLRLLDRRLLVGPELAVSTVISDSGDGFLSRLTTPVELVLGARYQVARDWRLGAGVAPGLTRALGTPAIRLLASVDFSPAGPGPERKTPPVLLDLPRDGVLNESDDCPAAPGTAEHAGCPPKQAITDKDADGVADGGNRCPEQAGIGELAGCPRPQDQDADGIVDAEDKCPAELGTVELAGCPPPPDRDADGILDAADRCPDEPGGADEGQPDRHGCPRASIMATEIETVETVDFEAGVATLLPQSTPALSAVLELLRKHPEIRTLRVECHTDNRGHPYLLRKLSQRRAETVVAWLVEHGVDAVRLEAQGVGPERPIANNDTDLGRQRNRRVEFHIVNGPESNPAR